MVHRALCLVLGFISISACHSAGPYGFARQYTPTDEETAALKGSEEYDPVMARRFAHEWRKKRTSFFGIVTQRSQGASGATQVRLSVRKLAPRNLCDSSDESSCRVTVSDREHAIVHVQLQLKGEDDVGKLSVGTGSLLRVVGKLGDRVDESDGGPIFRAVYYRHYPRNYFVTTKDRATMRR